MILFGQRFPLKVIALVFLVAMTLGGVWLGYESAGVTVAHSSESAKGSLPALGANGAQDGLNAALEKFLQQGEMDALDELLPAGVTEISGRGGRGLQRQVRSHGLWFPVFDLSGVKDLENPEAGQVAINQVPLMIVDSHPNPGRVNEWLKHRFTAVGGLPPYAWSLQIEGESSFTLDSNTGDFSGMSEEPMTLAMNVFVTDAEGTQASVATNVIIASEEPLMIVTDMLPEAVPGQVYTAQLIGAGGAQPYVWSLAGGPKGWVCDESTGMISGSLDSAGEHSLRVVLSDTISQVEKTFVVGTEGGLTIVTSSPLAPAAPGAFYSGRFEAAGGVEPYVWSMETGQLPPGWSLTPEGEMTGTAPEGEARFDFQVRVEDAAGQTFEKGFQLTVSQGLLVIASREKAGLAWQYESMSAALGAPVSGVVLTRNGTEIYRGQGTNMVDRNLVTGASYSYELTAVTADGRWLPYAAAVANILPMSRQRGQPGVSGDAYADRVVQFDPLSPGGYGSASLPSNVTGPPDGRSTFTPAHLPNEVLSLHATTGGGGSIVLEFTDNIIEAGSGQDFTVFENVFFKNNDPNQRFMEPATVEVALFEGQWHRFPIRVNVAADGTVDLFQPAYYAQGFAGVNATTGEDPTNPSSSGGDSFDLAALGRQDLQWFRFIRLTSTGDEAMRDAAGKVVRHTDENNSLSGHSSSGFDLDAVSAVNY
ncbi:putative Ig domain-containing protein [Prosthecobacter sp. SYSU 5D2]|uniref:putative Ig domain-containing protein n=1 Tax=Prosthecobacter sp. SYSU 5D2 TaxID=3134134 RepID=UPI0031FF46FA